jgi:hypothetical protein
MGSGQVAQLVEQWTENPCVAGSIPALSTPQPSRMKKPGGVAGTFRDTLPGCFLK